MDSNKKCNALILLASLILSCGGGGSGGGGSGDGDGGGSSSVSLLTGAYSIYPEGDVDATCINTATMSSSQLCANAPSDDQTVNGGWIEWTNNTGAGSGGTSGGGSGSGSGGGGSGTQPLFPLIKANVCASVTEIGDFDLGHYKPAQYLQDININLKLDYIPLHYFAYWRNQGFYDLNKNMHVPNIYPIPIKLKATVQYGTSQENYWGAIAGSTFESTPEWMDTYLFVYDGTTRPAVTWVNDLANLAVGESNIMRQAGSELFNQRGGMGDFFFKRMVAYPGRPDLRVDGNFETLITELNISIPAYADHFIDFKFQNIPVHRITENYNASTHDLTYLPQNGCFDGMWEHSDFNDQGYVMGGDIFRFDTSAHPSQWWNQDMWMVPKY